MSNVVKLVDNFKNCQQCSEEIHIQDLKTHTMYIYPKKWYHSYFDKVKNSKDGFIIKEENGEFATQNYIGKFFHNGKIYDISCRYGDEFLFEMLKNTTSILFSKIHLANEKLSNSSGKISSSNYLLYILFIKCLKKAKLNGFPKVFCEELHKSFDIKGKICYKSYIKKDMIYKRSFTSRQKQHLSDKVLASVLLKAYKIISSEKNLNFEIDNTLLKFLKENAKDEKFNIYNIDKAINSKSLRNSLYKDYKECVKLARVIILNHFFLDCDSGKQNSLKNRFFGYIIYIPELFENYVEKILFKNLDKNHKLKAQEVNDRNRVDFCIADSKENIAVIDAKYRHFYKNGYLNQQDYKNIRQIKKYMKAYKTKIGVLFYAKSNMDVNYQKKYNDNKDEDNKIYLLNVLDSCNEIKTNFNNELSFLKNLKK